MDGQSRLIVGLGNPGREYDGTRHNVGFDVVDRYARRHGIPLNKVRNKAIVGDGMVDGFRIFLMKPQTYMNLSGNAVAAFLRQSPLQLAEVLVVVDDIALPTGKIRLRSGGSAGGHNGIKSLIASLGSQEFPRLRIGVGAPRDASVQVDYVLGKFNKSEQATMVDTIETALSAIHLWCTQDIAQAMNVVNAAPPKTK